MVVGEAIGGKDSLLRRTPVNPKYEKVKAVVESGMTAEVARLMKRTAGNVQRRPGESFMRILPKLLAEYILLLRKQSEAKNTVESDGGFAHPMDEYRPANERPEKEYLILDVRSEEEYKACHIEGAVHYPKRRMVHAMHPFLPEMLEFKNKENKYIVVYDLEEELTVGQNVGMILFEKGIDNVAVLTGGLREFVQDHSSLIVGESPVPIVPRDNRLQRRADALTTARSETQKSLFTHKPKSLSNSLAKPRKSIRVLLLGKLYSKERRAMNVEARQSVVEVNNFNNKPLHADSIKNGASFKKMMVDEEQHNGADAMNSSSEKVNMARWEKAHRNSIKRKSTPKIAKTRVTIGMHIKRWIITGRIGAGSFGETFTAVEEPRERGEGDDESATEDMMGHSHSSLMSSRRVEVCIKVEQENKNVLRIEAAALKKMQPCPQVVRYLGSGNTGGMNFLVMERLGPNLAELRRKTPAGAFTHYTTLKLGISCLRAIRGVHQLGLVHRDIKPSNFVIGLGGTSDPRTCYLIDFGLARRYRRANGEVRPPRENAGFRGTSRYASLASHRHQELGRVDDIWSLLFMLIEFATGTLPWRKYKEKEEIGQCKEEVIGIELVQSLPREFRPFLMHLKSLRYEDAPSYDFLLSLLERAIERRGYPPDKKFDWELDDEAFQSIHFPDEKILTKELVRSHDVVAEASALGGMNSLSHSVPFQCNSQQPRGATEFSPAVVNRSLTPPNAAPRLFPPSQTEGAAEDQTRLGVSDPIISVPICRTSDAYNTTHQFMECVGTLPGNTSLLTPHTRNNTAASEDEKEHAEVKCQADEHEKEKQATAEKVGTMDIEGEFSPRETMCTPKNGDQIDKRSVVGPSTLKDAVEGNRAPHSIFVKHPHDTQEGIEKKKVTFSTNVEDTKDEAVPSRNKAAKKKKSKKSINCKCNAM